MKILFLTSGRRVPSSRFRMLQYVPHLRRLGHQCVVAHSRPPKYEHYRLLGWRPSQKLRRFLRHLDCLRIHYGGFDVVILERELFHDETYDMEAAIRRACRTMLLDIDDGVFLDHPAKFQAIATMCDAVIAGNQSLAEEALKSTDHVSVIPTSIDLRRYTPRDTERDPSQPLLLGWTGTAANLTNLTMLADPLKQLARNRQFRFRVIAESYAPVGKLNFEDICWEHRPWREPDEIHDLQQFDIGVMPLEDNPWNRYKCGFKIIQYMGLGVPAVASPVGTNCEIIQDGNNGFLASSNEQWLSRLTQLIDDAALRQQLGDRGRQTVRERYCVETNLPLLVQACEQAIARTRG